MNDRPQSNIGIVLSGGGTRGIAHIGVLRALAEQGIFPDGVAGASAGAIVGALYAAGYAPAEMLEFFVKKNPFRLSKVTIAKPGIIDTEKVKADFEEYFPEDSFEALGKRLRVVATDLTRGEPVEFDSGPLIPAVLASSSFPGMFTPMEDGERMLADGGIVSNFPAELLQGRCRVLLGVHVNPFIELTRSELNSSLAVLKRALDVGMYRSSEAKFALCDVVIRPASLARFGIFDTKHLDAIEAVGYEATVKQMPAIQQAVRPAQHGS
ncbi:MAG: patatin-like phospholipase family protein [Acidobacteriota bacterium]|nr:MAG: patatin-like phospholipase family protein [Acidobacteriota bacterium]